MKIHRPLLAALGVLLFPVLRADLLIVTSTNDSGPGTLREALLNASWFPGPNTITFAPALSGKTILLSGTARGSAITIADTEGVTLDATSLSDGLTLNGGLQNFRLFFVPSGSRLTLNGITLTNGNPSGAGGADYNQGELTLIHCTLFHNSGDAFGGGAIYNGGTLTLTHCTLSGNGGIEGGAINNSGSVNLSKTAS